MSTWNQPLSGPDQAHRRSQRVIVGVPVNVRTEGAPREKSFEEDTQTIVVNAHGALVGLKGKTEKGQTLRLTNRATKEELLCRVVYTGPVQDSKAQIGIEFLKPSPDFWRISFPPEDWVTPEPATVGQKKR